MKHDLARWTLGQETWPTEQTMPHLVDNCNLPDFSTPYEGQLLDSGSREIFSNCKTSAYRSFSLLYEIHGVCSTIVPCKKTTLFTQETHSISCDATIGKATDSQSNNRPSCLYHLD